MPKKHAARRSVRGALRARDENVRRGITRLMALDEGRKCKILEGPGVEVVQLFAKIRADQRHRDVIEVVTTPIDQRHFGERDMAQRRMVDVVSLAFAI